MIKNILRYSLRIAGTILCLLFLAWIALVVYVQLHKRAILDSAENAINTHLQGDAHIGSLEISFFRHFPSITVHLSDVWLRDSAWRHHHHDLLKATDAYASCNLWKSLLHHNVALGQVDLEHGQLYFYTDSTGYTNTYLLHERKAQTAGRSGKPADLPEIELIDMHFVMERQDKHKLFDLDVHHLTCAIQKNGRQLRLDVRPTIHVNSFSFNTVRGSFIKNKILSGHFAVDYNTASKIIQFAKATVDIDGHPFTLTGRFFPSVIPDPLFLEIQTEDIRFHDATALLTPNIQQKIDQYDIDKPISVHATVDAGAADDLTPQIHVQVNLDHSDVQIPPGRFTDASFKASFINEWKKGQKRDDENSAIRILAFTGTFDGIPVRSDTILITNLKHPQMNCDLHSQFSLDRLNDLTGSQTLQFTNGSGNMDLVYAGPLSENDTSGTTVNGHLDLDSAGLVYLPNHFRLTGGKGQLLFKDQDLVIGSLAIHAGGSRIMVKGIGRNFIALLDRNTENISMNWRLNAQSLDLQDLLPLISRPTTAPARRNTGSAFGETFARIDDLLKQGAIHVNIDAADMRFRKFAGAHGKADLLFDNHEIRLNKLSIEQGAGSLQLKATLSHKGDGDESPLTAEAHLDDVDLPHIFSAFDNFGQEAVTAKNLKGNLTADVHLTGDLNSKAKILTRSLKGSVRFTIRSGQLVDFAPMEKVRVSVLKKRDLSEIKFAELQNQLDVDSTTIFVHRMEISSTAFTLFVEGTYDLKRGVDMSLQVPLSNLSKDRNQDIPPTSKGNEGKAGPSLHLRARTGDDGKLRVSWDPFRRALKKVR